jgi:hypothetical protein
VNRPGHLGSEPRRHAEELRSRVFDVVHSLAGARTTTTSGDQRLGPVPPTPQPRQAASLTHSPSSAALPRRLACTAAPSSSLPDLPVTEEAADVRRRPIHHCWRKASLPHPSNRHTLFSRSRDTQTATAESS